MTEYIINRDKDDLMKFMKTKADKMGLQCRFEENKVIVEAKPGTDMHSQMPIPTMFKGKITEDGSKSKISGRFSYGFYLTTLVIVAAILIVARLIWSVYQMQRDNIILCIVVAVLLVVVCIVVKIQGEELKDKIGGFLEDLNKR